MQLTGTGTFTANNNVVKSATTDDWSQAKARRDVGLPVWFQQLGLLGAVIYDVVSIAFNAGTGRYEATMPANFAFSGNFAVALTVDFEESGLAIINDSDAPETKVSNINRNTRLTGQLLRATTAGVLSGLQRYGLVAATNLLPNGSFELGTFGYSEVAPIMSGGTPGPSNGLYYAARTGSVSAYLANSSNDSNLFIPVSGSRDYLFGVDVFTNDLLSTFWLGVFEFDSAKASLAITPILATDVTLAGAGISSPNANTWYRLEKVFTTLSTTRWLAVQCWCNRAYRSNVTAGIDNMFLGAAGPIVKAGNGNQYRIVASNSGVLSTVPA